MPPESGVTDDQRLRSGTRGDQPRLMRRIVVHPPCRRQRLIEVEEVAQARTIAAANDLLGYGVAAQTHAIGHARESRFEPERLPSRCELIEPLQHGASGGDRSGLRAWQSASEDIGIQ